MTVSFLAAVATIPLMKRVLVFMILFLCPVFAGLCPFAGINMQIQSGQVWANTKKFAETFGVPGSEWGRVAQFRLSN